MNSIPLNAEIKITNAAVETVIPRIEIPVIKLMAFLFLHAKRYLLAIKKETLYDTLFLQ